jgi:hypothetical protein
LLSAIDYENLTRMTVFKRGRVYKYHFVFIAEIDEYIQHSSKEVNTVTVNRELATLRRLLRIAVEWKLIPAVPKIRLLKGERQREFVLSPA